MKNKISKITILTLLLISGTVNAQNFYTCVPENDWVKDRAKEVIRDEAWFKKNFELNMLPTKFKVAKTEVDDDNIWKLVYENKTSGILEPAIYKVIVAGGAGGKGGNGVNGGYACGQVVSGGLGGKGQIQKKVFLLNSDSNFSAIIGKKGADGDDDYVDGNCCEVKGKTGKNGSGSSFKLYNIQLYADYGRGGTGGFNDDGKCGTIGNTECKCIVGNVGYGYSGGNSGDGYVKIYKYKG